jgi:hypothetical protein
VVSPEENTRPCSDNAFATSIHWAPAPTRTVFFSVSMISIAFSGETSMTTPPSLVLKPAGLCPPLRTEISRSFSRANSIDERTSSLLAHCTTTTGLPSWVKDRRSRS